MSYNYQDERNVEACKELFKGDEKVLGLEGHRVLHIPLIQIFYPPEATIVLTDALKSASRSDQTIHIWIDIQSYYFPAIVMDALENCAGFEASLVITHDEKSSHGPGRRFPLSTMKKLALASSTQPTWHPILKVMVPSMKNWVLTMAELDENHLLFQDPRAIAGYYMAVAEVVRLEGVSQTVDSLLVKMGGAEIAKLAADQDDLKVFTSNGIL